jgi:hypothetical protein
VKADINVARELWSAECYITLTLLNPGKDSRLDKCGEDPEQQGH